MAIKATDEVNATKQAEQIDGVIDIRSVSLKLNCFLAYCSTCLIKEMNVFRLKGGYNVKILLLSVAMFHSSVGNWSAPTTPFNRILSCTSEAWVLGYTVFPLHLMLADTKLYLRR